MKKIVGIVGSGMIGRDPWDPNCWSRSGYNLFTHLKAKGVLKKAIGVEVPIHFRAPVMLKNFSPSRRTWSQKFNLDPMYYEMLTKEICAADQKEPFGKDCAVLQIGGHYNAAKATGLPSYSYHDGNISGLMNSPFFPKKFMGYAKRAFLFEQATYKDMTKIFVMSDYWRNSFINDFNVPAEKVVNVGFGVNIDVPQVLQKSYEAKNVVFVGIDFTRKGGDSLVKAFNHVIKLSRHKDAKLHIVGPYEMPDVVRQYPEGVEFHGHLSRENSADKERLESILSNGNIFVLPSLYEPFGNAALEAMLYKMPAIASGDWSFPDFVIPEKTGILLKGIADIDEIYEAIIKLLDAPDLQKEWGENGFNLVTEKYTWENTVNNLVREIG